MSESFVTISVDVQPGGCIEFMGQQMILNKRIRDRLEDNRDFFKAEESTMSANFGAVWIEQQSVWPALSSQYLKWKIAHGFSEFIGILTAKLQTGMKKGDSNIQRERTWTWGIDPTESKWFAGGKALSYPEKFAERRPFAILLARTVLKLRDDYLVRLKKIWERSE